MAKIVVMPVEVWQKEPAAWAGKVNLVQEV